MKKKTFQFNNCKFMRMKRWFGKDNTERTAVHFCNFDITELVKITHGGENGFDRARIVFFDKFIRKDTVIVVRRRRP